MNEKWKQTIKFENKERTQIEWSTAFSDGERLKVSAPASVRRLSSFSLHSQMN